MIRRRVAWSVAGALLVASSASALDLETVLRQVAERSPTLAARDARVDAARARVPRAGAWNPPMLEAGVQNVPTSGRFDQDPMTMKMVGLTQRVPIFGANRLARRSALSALDAESAGATARRHEVLAEAIVAYADAHFAAEVAAHSHAHQSEMDRLVESARARYQSGRGRLDDVLRAESERARTIADLSTYRAEERAARVRLDALRGMPLGLPDEPLASPALTPVPPDAAPWLTAVSDSNPRLRELAAERERYRWAARAARRMNWPDLELRGSYGVRGALNATSEHGMAIEANQNDMYSASVGFMLPLFNGSRGGAEAAEMDAMARAAEAELRAADLDLRAEIAATHAMAGAAERNAGLLADTVIVLQRRAVSASWSAYIAGTTDLWRVFEASHALFNEEVALERARQDLARAVARLMSLTGRSDLMGVGLPPTHEEKSR